MALRSTCVWCAIVLGAAQVSHAAEPALAEYFKVETAKLSARPLMGVTSAQSWTQGRPEFQRQMREMLGLWPEPVRGDLHVEIRGISVRPDFVIEKILYQSVPGLYVTANLYRPKVVKSPIPAIVYVCGHSEVKKDGVIYGNKAHYQHHAAWYAANGYVCIVLDTLQLGELPGLHQGTYHEGMWWWHSRGYTPAGIEAWNAVRAIDYLISRPEVDKTKIGVTGRSGGGATSWWVGAIDDRVAAVCPVAGITDLFNHIVDGKNTAHPHGVVEGHCDCMYFVNTYRWDFPMVAALVAPKPLLVENTDQDPIFPEDGVRRIYDQLEKVYGWYGASEKLGLVIGKGGHVDSEEIRHPSFAFFEKWLKGKPNATIEEPDRKVPIEELRVLKVGEFPSGCKNSTIHETFVAVAEIPAVPKDQAEWGKLKTTWLKQLSEQVFAGWPPASELERKRLDMNVVGDLVRHGFRFRTIEFTSQPGVRLRIWVFTDQGQKSVARDALYVLGQSDWDRSARELIAAFESGEERGKSVEILDAVRQGTPKAGASILFAPRGVGPTAWASGKEDVQTRRRFALLGQTVDGMQVWDTLAAVAVIRSIDDLANAPIGLGADRSTGVLVGLAAAFDGKVDDLSLIMPTDGLADRALLNFQRVLGVPQAMALVHPRPVVLGGSPREPWSWTIQLGERLSPGKQWPGFMSPAKP